MSSATDQVRQAALALPEDDRVELIETLIVSLESDGRPPFDESWHEVIQRRSAELRSGAVAPVSWEEVKREARGQFRG